MTEPRTDESLPLQDSLLQDKSPTSESLRVGAHTVAELSALLPSEQAVLELAERLQGASSRGYLTPDEDEALRELFAAYLTCRGLLLQTVNDLKPLATEIVRRHGADRPETFLVAFACGVMLMRTARYLIDSFRDNDVIRRKLDEADPRLGIPRKQFTQIYRSYTSLRNMWTFVEASRYWEANKPHLLESVARTPEIDRVIELLERETPTFAKSRRHYLSKRLGFRLYSFLRRNRSGFQQITFALFQASGRVISELRWPWKRKRVLPAVQRKLARLLQPGDVIVTRHDDAVTNFFLPGFWPHAALYIGTEEQRDALNMILDEARQGRARDPVCILEARKDGVLFRELSNTLQVDACVVIRPKLAMEELRKALLRAVSHEGKDYDFEFDFCRSDKLVCTEVVYRAYHGCGPCAFELTMRAGRLCLSAEDLLDRACDGSLFDVVAIYGIHGNRFATGEAAKRQLIESYRKAENR